MSDLKKGEVPEEQFYYLLQLTGIRSENLILALKDHLINGLTGSQACEKYHVNKGLFSRRLTVIKSTNKIVKELIKFYH